MHVRAGTNKDGVCLERNTTVASDLNHSALIGWQDLQKLCVIPASFPAVAAVARCYSDMKTKTLSAFPDVFSDTFDSKPMCAQKMRIYLKDNYVPYRVSAPRPIPLRFQEPANAEISKYIVGPVCHCTSHMRTQDTLSCPE